MGFTGLARWMNAPTTGLDQINENILRNHGGSFRSKWSLSVKSYRTIPNSNSDHLIPDRNMYAVTMGENAFVLLEDHSAPTRVEALSAAAQAAEQKTVNGTIQDITSTAPYVSPTHYRTTYITVTPPHSLELLLAQLRARWQSVRQATGQTRGQGNPSTGGSQLIIEGNVFAIGSDWLVRAGNVVLAGGTVRGILLEAEYLPLHVMPVQTVDGRSPLLSDLLTSLLPRVPDAKTVAVTIPPGQWEEVLYSGDPTEPEADDAGENTKQPKEDETPEETIDDVYVYGVPPSRARKGDWQGIDRDRRAAFLIIGALKSEGLL